MKSGLLLSVGLLTLSMSAPALAADLPAGTTYTKAPVMAAAYDWSGFYLGANAGGGSSHNCWDLNTFLGIPLNPALSEGCHNATGALAGGQIGYRWQLSNWVFGVEAQGDWANLKGSNTSALFGPGVSNHTKVDGVGLFTGQVGYAWNNVLWYAKGGAAVTHANYNGIITGVSTIPVGSTLDSASETRWGGVVGTGIEINFAPGWSVGFEYDHLFMGNRSVDLAAAPAAGVGNIVLRSDNIRQDVDMGTVRLNYRWGGPVVAKY